MAASATTLLALAFLLAIAVSAAVGSNPRAAVDPSSSASATSQKAAAGAAASAAVGEPAGDEEQQSPLLPVQYFPLMQKFQRCLFVCRYCYDSHAVRLLHCANAWCLGRVQKSLRLPERAYTECPAMRLIED